MCGKWKTFFLTLILVNSSAALSQPREDFRIDRRGGPDLVRESKQLQLMSEPTAQRESWRRESRYAIGAGSFVSGKVNVESDATRTQYDLSDSIPMVRLSYSQLPWLYKGEWGWQFNVGYAFKDTKVNAQRVSLHLVPLSAEIIYKIRWNDTAKWAPQLGAGGGNISYFQRGGPGLNTSGSDWFGTYSLGVWFDLGAWGDPKAVAPIDLLLSYNQLLSEESDAKDWAGESWFLTVGVSL